MYNVTLLHVNLTANPSVIPNILHINMNHIILLKIINDNMTKIMKPLHIIICNTSRVSFISYWDNTQKLEQLLVSSNHDD